MLEWRIPVRRKLLVLLMICILLMTLLTSCRTGSKSLRECGEEIISLMAEMIEYDECASLYALPPSCDEVIRILREGNYMKSVAVYELLIPEEALLEKTVKKESLSEAVYEYICSSAFAAFASYANQGGGVESVAVSTVYSVQKSFVYNDADSNKLYIYVFEGGCPIVVTFVPDGEDLLRAVGHFIINDKFVTEDENSIKESCKMLGLDGVIVNKVN